MKDFKVEITDTFKARSRRAAATAVIQGLRDTSSKNATTWRVRVTDLETEDAYDIYFDKNTRVVGEDPVDPLDY